MEDFKKIKDPIYGYIKIPTKYMNDIIDTAAFQRLRRIIQTSYSPLYPSAVHNRFAHSLGVYHLGQLAIESLFKNICDKFVCPENVDRLKDIFLLACLLHDVGHAPFSHTGETFYQYNQENNEPGLSNELTTAVSDTDFTQDYNVYGKAAPHEIMSVIIALEEYSWFFDNNSSGEKSFFARCITGCTYSYSSTDPDYQIRNCLIYLLNSNVIDVDKLDYLIRDSYISGYNSVRIDYERLLTSLTIIVRSNNQYELAYQKNALSVLENVVYAHDAERKWIQTHPIVMYESFLLQSIIRELNSKINDNGNRLFSSNSLRTSGQSFKIGSESININLLCDDDIIFLMKNVYPSKHTDEYFERKKRRHPIWKSESEYNAYFLYHAEEYKGVLDIIEEKVESIDKYMRHTSSVINNDLIKNLEDDLKRLENIELDDYDIVQPIQINEKKGLLRFVKCLREISCTCKIPFNFVILLASQFKSGFMKDSFTNLKIVFKKNDEDIITKFGEIGLSLEGKIQKREKFFYLFYKREDQNNSGIDIDKVCKHLLNEYYKDLSKENTNERFLNNSN